MMLQNSFPIQLHELFEPPPVPFSFDAPGWYVLGGVLLVAVLLIAIFRVRTYIKNRYRRDALRELGNLEHTPDIFPQLFVVLKNTAIHAFGREQVAPLYGKEWLDFLEKTGVNVKWTDYREEILPAVYCGNKIKPEIQEKLLSNAKKWVRTHAG